MNSLSPRIYVLPMLLFLLIFVCAACSNQQEIDTAKHIIADKEQPASENADKEQAVTHEVGTLEAITKETTTSQSSSLSVVDQAVAPVDAAPTSKPSVTEPSVKVISESITEAPAQATITISITSNEKKGVILEPTSTPWEDGDSVLDVLKRVTKSNKITLDYKGVGMLSYVEGIANVYEFDEGTNSGWLFKINGKYATRSAGAVKLSIGDNVEWIYSIKKDEELDE